MNLSLVSCVADAGLCYTIDGTRYLASAKEMEDQAL